MRNYIITYEQIKNYLKAFLKDMKFPQEEKLKIEYYIKEIEFEGENWITSENIQELIETLEICQEYNKENNNRLVGNEKAEMYLFRCKSTLKTFDNKKVPEESKELVKRYQVFSRTDKSKITQGLIDYTFTFLNLLIYLGNILKELTNIWHF